MKFLSQLKFTLYMVSLIVGVIGVWLGGKPILIHAIDRIDGSFTANYEVLFKQGMIFMGSLVLLMGVHLGHSLANAFKIEEHEEQENQKPIHNLAGTPWDKNQKVARYSNPVGETTDTTRSNPRENPSN